MRIGSAGKVALALGWLAGNASAAVVLTLHNTVSLVDSNGMALANGDLVQFILTGPNWLIDPPDIYGNPGGDDSLVTLVNNPTYIGIGVSGSSTGEVAQSMTYEDALIGPTNSYVRFWNGPETHLATGYGVTDLLDLPEPVNPFFRFADLDFAPLISNPHQVNIMFNAQQAVLVPEPSSFAFALFLGAILMVRRRWRSAARIGTFVLPFAVLAMCCGDTAHGQIPPRFYVDATVGVVDATGNTLPGNNPDSFGIPGYIPIPGSVVQLLNVGTNGVADLPDGQGLPTGDDTVLETSQVGFGIPPTLPQSGLFSFSLNPGPVNGAKVYVRIFDQPTIAASTQWGQSNCFVVDGVSVFTVNRWGLWGTIVPKTGDPGGVDTDGDGQSDLAEMVANTSAGDENDFLAAGATTKQPGAGVQVALDAKSGRDYRLMRNTVGLMSPTSWVPVDSVDALTAPDQVLLQDPTPPTTETEVFYAIEASMP